MAQEKVWEVKASQFGRITAQDRNSSIQFFPKEGYRQKDYKEVYKKAVELYELNEIVRPVINIIAAAVFSNGAPDVRGSNTKLVELARKIIDRNGINFHDLAREGELAGDVFLWFKPDGEKTEIRSLDASKVQPTLKNDNIRDITGYKFGETEPKEISKELIEHLKFNATTTSLRGRSSLRHVIYWLDVSDTLFEKNWLRGAQYFGFPFLAITGVPGPYQQAVKDQMEAQVQRAGRTLVLPPDSDVKTPDLSLNFPIGEIIGWVFRLISIATEIPITILGSADAESRGSAFFATPRFSLSIKPRREVWRIGLRNFFIKIFKNLGEVGQDEIVTSKEFDFGFLPIFDRDLADLADLIEILRDRKIISKQSAREMVGLDHTDEEERIEDEPEEEILVTPDPTDPNAPPGSKPQAQARPKSIRKEKKNQRRPSIED